jgi:hypothetical protein
MGFGLNLKFEIFEPFTRSLDAPPKKLLPRLLLRAA